MGASSLIAYRRFHFIDGAVNFTNGVVPLANESRAIIRLQHSARLPQVREGVEIVGTRGLSLCSQGKEKKSRQPKNRGRKIFEDSHFATPLCVNWQPELLAGE